MTGHDRIAELAERYRREWGNYQPVIRSDFQPTGDTVRVRVTHDAPGLPEDVREHIRNVWWAKNPFARPEIPL